MKPRNRILFLILLLLSCSSIAQERTLTKKIVYRVEIQKPNIVSSKASDSINYRYSVDKRFWWESLDIILPEIKKDSTLISNLKDKYLKYYNDSLSDIALERMLDDEIREIEFWEEWKYGDDMLISKEVIAFTPIIRRDSVIIVDIDNHDTDLDVIKGFEARLDWIYPRNSTKKDTVCMIRNIEFTMPIYNPKPYRWWESNIEAEYSIPYLNRLMEGVGEGRIEAFDSPNSSSALNRMETRKKRKFEMMTRIIKEDSLFNVFETDTIIEGSYDAYSITHLRFGEEWVFDKSELRFYKKTNYISPMIEIRGLDNSIRGLMPMYYIRRTLWE